MSIPASISSYYYSYTITIVDYLCVNCLRCLGECPAKGTIGLNKDRKVFVRNPDTCKGCFKCIKVCPAKAIRVKKIFNPDMKKIRFRPKKE